MCRRGLYFERLTNTRFTRMAPRPACFHVARGKSRNLAPLRLQYSMSVERCQYQALPSEPPLVVLVVLLRIVVVTCFRPGLSRQHSKPAACILTLKLFLDARGNGCGAPGRAADSCQGGSQPLLEHCLLFSKAPCAAWAGRRHVQPRDSGQVSP